jgi:hypothetical protein
MSSHLTWNEKYKLNEILVFFYLAQQAPPPPPQWARASYLSRFLDQTQRHPTVGRTPLWTSQRPLRDITQHSQQTDIRAPGGIRNRNLSRRAAIDRADTGTSISCFTWDIFSYDVQQNHVTCAILLFVTFTCISLCGFQRSLNPLYAGYLLCIKKSRDCIVCHATRKTNDIFSTLYSGYGWGENVDSTCSTLNIFKGTQT